MPEYFVRLLLACIVFLLWPSPATRSCCAWAEADARSSTTTYRVELADPVSPSTPPRVHDVVLSRDRNGFPFEYSLSFKTSVCTDGKCREVELTMV
jgi:hypothetical protein